MKYLLDQINEEGGSFVYSYLLDDRGKAVEIRKNPAGTDERPLFETGSIYIGMVTKAALNLDAVFVDIAPGKNCYLPAHSIKNPIYAKKGPSGQIAQGDQVVVQVTKEGTSLKSPALTTEFTLPGHSCVLARSGRSGVSRRVSDPDRKERLKEMALQGAPDGYSFVMRTVSAALPESEILQEMEQLAHLAASVEKRASHALCYTCLYEAPAPFLRSLLQLPADPGNEILVENTDLYEQVKTFLQETYPPLVPRLRLYADSLLPMAKCYLLERERSEAEAPRVWLKNGAFLIISYTEALTVIDVNSGKAVPSKKKSREEVVLSVNLEAAGECMRQLRLRNLRGIILIDFINMKSKESEEELMSTLRSLALADPGGTAVVDITRLGLVEITRKST